MITSNASSPHVMLPGAHQTSSSELYDDEELRIPSARASADSVLLWPSFEQRYPANYLVCGLFSQSFHADTRHQGLDTSTDYPEKSLDTGKLSIGVSVEDNVVQLVEAFSILVHPKNPVLNPATLRRYARSIEENGIGWDERSCLVVSWFFDCLLSAGSSAICRPSAQNLVIHPAWSEFCSREPITLLILLIKTLHMHSSLNLQADQNFYFTAPLLRRWLNGGRTSRVKSQV